MQNPTVAPEHYTTATPANYPETEQYQETRPHPHSIPSQDQQFVAPEDDGSPFSPHYDAPPYPPPHRLSSSTSSAPTLYVNTDVQQRPISRPSMDHLRHAYGAQAARACADHLTSSTDSHVKTEPVDSGLPHHRYNLSSPASASTTASSDNQIYTHVSMLPRAPGALHAEGGSRSTFRMTDFIAPESPSSYIPRLVEKTDPCPPKHGHSASFAIDLTGSVTCDDGHGCGSAAKKKKEPFLACYFCRGRKIG